jgi:hypothetical protein
MPLSQSITSLLVAQGRSAVQHISIKGTFLMERNV